LGRWRSAASEVGAAGITEIGAGGGGSCSGLLAEEADHHALNDELGGGEEVGIARIFGAEKGAAALDEETFQRGFAVDESGDDGAGTRIARREEDGVAVEDMGAGHGIAADAEGEKAGAGGDAEGGGIDGEVAVGLLFGGGGEAGGNGAVEGDFQEGSAEGGGEGGQVAAGFAGVMLEGALAGEGAEVVDGGGLAGEAEMGLNLTRGGRVAVAALVIADETEDLALASGEFGRGSRWHTVQLNSDWVLASEE
jgi:hypothetical protein